MIEIIKNNLNVLINENHLNRFRGIIKDVLKLKDAEDEVWFGNMIEAINSFISELGLGSRAICIKIKKGRFMWRDLYTGILTRSKQ